MEYSKIVYSSIKEISPSDFRGIVQGSMSVNMTENEKDPSLVDMVIGITADDVQTQTDTLAKALYEKFGIYPDVAQKISVADTLVLSASDIKDINNGLLDPSTKTDPVDITLTATDVIVADPASDPTLLQSVWFATKNFFSNLFS